MNNPDPEPDSVVTPEIREKAKRLLREIEASADFKRFCDLGDRYHSGEATPEEREEYEKETEWMRNLPRSPIPGLIPDDHPLSMGGFPSKSKKPRHPEENPSADQGD